MSNYAKMTKAKLIEEVEELQRQLEVAQRFSRVRQDDLKEAEQTYKELDAQLHEVITAYHAQVEAIWGGPFAAAASDLKEWVRAFLAWKTVYWEVGEMTSEGYEHLTTKERDQKWSTELYANLRYNNELMDSFDEIAHRFLGHYPSSEVFKTPEVIEQATSKRTYKLSRETLEVLAKLADQMREALANNPDQQSFEMIVKNEPDWEAAGEAMREADAEMAQAERFEKSGPTFQNADEFFEHLDSFDTETPDVHGDAR